MGAGFISRYTSTPSIEQLTAIEGVSIIDLPPPGSITGVGTGVVGIVGEFADMSSAVQVDATGNVTSFYKPVELFGTQDFVAKLGGWDATLGDFGGANGNGFAAVRGKKFSRLVAVPINLCSAKAVRLWRELPTNKDANTPDPIVPVSGLSVAAGTEFKTGAGNRVRVGARVTFTDDIAYGKGTDGNVTASASAATAGQVFSGQGPFDFRGLANPQLRVHFNGGGNLDVNLAHGPAIVPGGAAAYPVTTTLGIQIGTGPTQVIQVNAAADAAHFAEQVSEQLFDGKAKVNGVNIDIYSDEEGTGAHVHIASVNDTIGTSGFVAGADQVGTGDIAKWSAVTPAEIKAKADALPLVNGTCVLSGDAKSFGFVSSTTGAASSAQVDAASTATLRCGFDNALHSGSNAVPTTTLTNPISSTQVNFQTLGAAKGDLVVIGVIGGAGALGANAGTYRIVSVDSATQVTVEKLDGSAFSFTTANNMPFRLHVGKTGDTGGVNKLSDAGGYTIPARPLDATIASATSVSPTLAAAAGTATTWLPASSLTLRTDPTTGVVYDANVQAPNVATTTELENAYSDALAALLVDDNPARDVNIVFSARASNNIAGYLKQHVLDASAQGIGRTACISPAVSQTSFTTITGDAAPGAGAQRDERVDYVWPPHRTYIREALNVVVKTADGKNTDDGMLDLQSDSLLASVLSMLPPERNPGEVTDTTKKAMAVAKAFGRGIASMTRDQYVTLKAKGIVALRFDTDDGPLFQSGVTTSLTAGQKNINRRRMADFIEDSIAKRLNQLAKLPLTDAWKKDVEGETRAFLKELRSDSNPAFQRIADFAIDAKSGNSQELEAKGIFVIIVQVRTVATADAIVVQAEIGEGVVTTSTN